MLKASDPLHSIMFVPHEGAGFQHGSIMELLKADDGAAEPHKGGQ